MEILGIGPSELIFIIILAIIILGPKDMQKAGRTVGRWLNRLIHSDGWQIFQKTSAEMRNLPTRLMREANLEMQETEKELRKAVDMRETEKDLRKAMDMREKPLASQPTRVPPPSNEPENTIQPPTVIDTPAPDSDPEKHG